MEESDRHAAESPWPTKKDRLFVRPSKPDEPPPELDGFESLLKSLGPDLGYAYREAYFRAGEILAHAWLEDDRNGYLKYPMLFCFRHFVELSLKAIIEVYCELLECEPGIAVEKAHGPMKLWNEAKRLMDEAVPNTGTGNETSRNVERCLNELHQVDRDSQLFRYPTSKDGQSVEARLPRVDVDRFFATMRHLEALFFGCQAQAEHLIGCRDDLRDYYGP